MYYTKIKMIFRVYIYTLKRLNDLALKFINEFYKKRV